MEWLDNNYRSSAGIIAAAQSIIGGQASGEAIRAAGHQVTEEGDLQAGRFADPNAEADFIVGRIRDLVGAPFEDRRNDAPRGLTYGDIAVLCRSVRQSAGAVVEALAAAGIPHRVSGLGGLFAAPEVRAVVKSFLFLAGRPELIREGRRVVSRRAVTADDVAQAWRQADVGFSDTEIAAGITYLEEQQTRYRPGGDQNG